MLDRENVIKALEICVNRKPGEYTCNKCPYETRVDGDGCEVNLNLDALAMLKEQGEDKPKGHWMPYEPDKRGYTDGFTCSRCERVILSDHYCKMIDFDFCPYCGAYMDNAEGR